MDKWIIVALLVLAGCVVASVVLFRRVHRLERRLRALTAATMRSAIERAH